MLCSNKYWNKKKINKNNNFLLAIAYELVAISQKLGLPKPFFATLIIFVP